MRPDQLAAHPLALEVKFQLNPCVESFVPTLKANKLLQHRREQHEEGNASVSKHQTCLSSAV